MTGDFFDERAFVTIPFLLRRAVRTLLGLLAGTALLVTSACGFDAQTLQPYTPAMG